MNVLSPRPGPERAVACATCCANGSSTARSVLVRRSQFRLEQDRAPPRSARRLSHRLPQPRRGDPHHPLEDEPKAELIAGVQAHRRAGRSDPQHAPALAVASSKRSRSSAEHDKLTKERRELKPLLKSDDQQWETHRRRGEGDAERFGKKTALGRRRTTLRRCARGVEIDLSRGADREGADHRHPLREGLDPRAQGPSGRARQARRSSRATG